MVKALVLLFSPTCFRQLFVQQDVWRRVNRPDRRSTPESRGNFEPSLLHAGVTWTNKTPRHTASNRLVYPGISHADSVFEKGGILLRVDSRRSHWASAHSYFYYSACIRRAFGMHAVGPKTLQIKFSSNIYSLKTQSNTDFAVLEDVSSNGHSV